MSALDAADARCYDLAMEAYQREFLDFCVRAGVLLFGDFTTKSGRKTPYFVNTGRFRSRRHATDNAVKVGQRESLLDNEAGGQIERYRPCHCHIVAEQDRK